MLGERKLEEKIWRGRWLVIAIAVVLMLAAYQVLRVNQPLEKVEDTVTAVAYTARGPLLTGNISIDPNGFHSVRMDLNRKAKLAGNFRTPSTKQRVGILVLDEANFESWKAQGEFRPIVATGVVPGGRISPVLGPGTFFLVIDNRASDTKQTVETEFSLD